MLKELGEYLSENFLTPVLSKFFAEKLELLGLGAIIAFLLASAFSYLAYRTAIEWLSPPPEDRLLELDSLNEEGLRQAFQDITIVLALSAHLGRTSANTFEEFREQVEALSAPPESAFDRIDADDDQVMKQLLERHQTVAAMARLLSEPEATSIEALREQVLRLQTR